MNAVHRLRLAVSDSNVLIYTENILNDKSSACSNLCCSPTHTVNKFNIETEKSEQTLSAQISLSQY